MSFLASVREAIGASYSLENERTADELGIKLTAMACYDACEASQVFHKMHLHNIESGMGLSLQEESKNENAQKYQDTSCVTLKKLFWDVLKPGGGSPAEDDGETLVEHGGKD
eukprot:CCRYP_002203-RA/>CCRYP_002203-RA protein AED:0.08 eAED:0.10 QI:986/0.5/0.33/1/0/0.33/3/0/111